MHSELVSASALMRDKPCQCGFIWGDGNTLVATATGPDTIDKNDLEARETCPTAEEQAANMKGLVACWNACEGLNPEAVPELVGGVRDVIGYLETEADFGVCDCSPSKMVGACDVQDAVECSGCVMRRAARELGRHVYQALTKATE